MRRLFSLRVVISLFMAFVISNISQVYVAEAAAESIVSTLEVVEQMSRAEAQAKINSHVQRAEVQKELAKLGLSTTDLSSRLASLSDQELQNMAIQMDNAQYGGVTGILVVVVLVLLIIYLARRI